MSGRRKVASRSIPVGGDAADLESVDGDPHVPDAAAAFRAVVLAVNSDPESVSPSLIT